MERPASKLLAHELLTNDAFEYSDAHLTLSPKQKDQRKPSEAAPSRVSKGGKSIIESDDTFGDPNPSNKKPQIAKRPTDIELGSITIQSPPEEKNDINSKSINLIHQLDAPRKNSKREKKSRPNSLSKGIEGPMILATSPRYELKQS